MAGIISLFGAQQRSACKSPAECRRLLAAPNVPCGLQCVADGAPQLAKRHHGSGRSQNTTRLASEVQRIKIQRGALPVSAARPRLLDSIRHIRQTRITKPSQRFNAPPTCRKEREVANLA